MIRGFIFIAALFFTSPVFAADCIDEDVKNFVSGSYTILGHGQTKGPVPTHEELYAGSATITVENCHLTVKRCVNGTVESGEIAPLEITADKLPAWALKTPFRELTLQMASDADNYPVLYGGDGHSYEFWRPDHDAKITCP